MDGTFKRAAVIALAASAVAFDEWDGSLALTGGTSGGHVGVWCENDGHGNQIAGSESGGQIMAIQVSGF